MPTGRSPRDLSQNAAAVRQRRRRARLRAGQRVIRVIATDDWIDALVESHLLAVDDQDDQRAIEEATQEAMRTMAERHA